MFKILISFILGLFVKRFYLVILYFVSNWHCFIFNFIWSSLNSFVANEPGTRAEIVIADRFIHGHVERCGTKGLTCANSWLDFAVGQLYVEVIFLLFIHLEFPETVFILLIQLITLLLNETLPLKAQILTLFNHLVFRIGHESSLLVFEKNLESILKLLLQFLIIYLGLFSKFTKQKVKGAIHTKGELRRVSVFDTNKA